MFNQAGSNGVVGTDNDVSLGICRHFARGLEPYLRFQPGSVKEANKGKGQDDKQQDNPGEQHHNAEKPPNIAVKSNVTKSERTHYRQGPIDSSQPRMILPFRVQHDHVEENREEQNNADQKGGEFEERANIPARCRLVQKIGELRAEQLHGRFQPSKRPGGPSRAGKLSSLGKPSSLSVLRLRPCGAIQHEREGRARQAEIRPANYCAGTSWISIVISTCSPIATPPDSRTELRLSP